MRKSKHTGGPSKQWNHTSAAESPDLNISENAFNIIQSELSRIGLSEGWPKHDELEQRITDIIENIPRLGLKMPLEVFQNVGGNV